MYVAREGAAGRADLNERLRSPRNSTSGAKPKFRLHMYLHDPHPLEYP